MSQLWAPLHDIPAEGRDFSFTDPALFSEPWKEFGLPYSMRNPLQAALFVSPQPDGFLLTGRIQGTVAAPCDRCANDAVIPVDHEFQEFEPLPEADAEMDEEPSSLLRQGQQGFELDVAGLFWEQFNLAMPVKPLCRRDCKGLCPECGADLNAGPCACARDDGDPRMAALRGLKLDK